VQLGGAERRAARPERDAAIDVNRANQAEFETVKCIGPGRSGKILSDRQADAFMGGTGVVARVGGVGAGNAARVSWAGLRVGNAAYTALAPAERAAKASKRPKPVKPAKGDAASVKPVSSR
jgi:competence protein ComEA